MKKKNVSNTMKHKKSDYFERINPQEDLEIYGLDEISPEDDAMLYYFKEISLYKLLSAEEEKELSKKILNGDEAALEKLINSNLRLVVRIAKRYVSKEYPLIDIIQDGNMGLLSAAKKFDYRKNVRFATYAQWWIKQTIQRCLCLRRSIIYIPHRKAIKLRMIHGMIEAFHQEFNRYPTVGELSDRAGISREDIDRLLMTAGNSVVSLDDQLYEDAPSSRYMEYDENYMPERIMMKQSVNEMTDQMLNVLAPHEKTIIEKRYGFDNKTKKTLKNMGELFGISAETVRQIERKALKKMQMNFPHAAELLHT